MSQLRGGLFKQYSEWRTLLLRQVAHIEAFIDFSESEEIEEGVPQEVAAAVSRLAEEFAAHLADARAGERLRDGVRIAIIGKG
jgi:tRNA U34 5-carboxymethylaminomethyl modifying GTPase MnmE/TrmE